MVAAFAVLVWQLMSDDLHADTKPGPKPVVAEQPSSKPDSSGTRLDPSQPAPTAFSGAGERPTSPVPSERESPKQANATQPAGGSAPTDAPLTPAEKPPVPTTELPSERKLLYDLDWHMAGLTARTEHTEAFVEIQHILIAFRKEDGAETVGGKNVTRTKDEAKKLVAELYARAVGGEDFDKLVREYTNDAAPGIYAMVANAEDQEAHKARTVNGTPYKRNIMVPVFGDLAWRLTLNEIGVMDYDPEKSPFGWHIVKRIK